MRHSTGGIGLAKNLIINLKELLIVSNESLGFYDSKAVAKAIATAHTSTS
ncbi:hypothetical protein L0128_12925 [candidate division KSB1 bacterium]|nr:hypothetical protein [candidate division KSB1 bacterium]